MKTDRFILPTTRMPKLEQIISEYRKLGSDDGITSGELEATTQGSISQQDAAGSISFLTNLGILRGSAGLNKHRLTPFGRTFGDRIIQRGDTSQLWAAAAGKSKFMMDIQAYVQPGHPIKKSDLIAVVVVRAGRKPTPPASYAADTLLSIMKKAGLFREDKFGSEVIITLPRQEKRELFIEPDKIGKLEATAKPEFDVSKLVELCKEINECYDQKFYYATGMLIRAVLDHVAPIFQREDFNGIVNNYGGRSFKGQMKTLAGYRDVFDGYLHSHIKEKENLANAKQVDCAGSFDALLGEAIRLLVPSMPWPRGDVNAARASEGSG
jgi:hypothetical protein